MFQLHEQADVQLHETTPELSGWLQRFDPIKAQLYCPTVYLLHLLLIAEALGITKKYYLEEDPIVIFVIIATEIFLSPIASVGLFLQ